MARRFNPHSELLRDPALLLPGGRFRGHPRLDSNHRVVKEGSGIYLFDYDVTDALGNSDLTIDPVGTQSFTGDGIHLDSVTSVNNRLYDTTPYDSALASAANAFVIMRFRPYAISGNGILLSWKLQDPYSGIGIWIDSIGVNTSNANCFSISMASSANRIETSANSLSVNRWVTIVVDYSGSADLNRTKVWLDGKLEKSSFDAGSNPSTLDSGASNVRIAGDASLDEVNAEIALFAYGKTILGDGLAQSMSEDPYQILVP